MKIIQSQYMLSKKWKIWSQSMRRLKLYSL